MSALPPDSDAEHEGESSRRWGHFIFGLNAFLLVLGLIAVTGKVAENRRLARAVPEYIASTVAHGGREPAITALFKAKLLKAKLLSDLERKHRLSEGILGNGLAALLRQRAADATLPALDRAKAAFALRDYPEAERLAGAVARRPSPLAPEERDTLIEAVEITVWSYLLQVPDLENTAQVRHHFRDATTLCDQIADPLGWARINDAVAHGDYAYTNANGGSLLPRVKLQQEIASIFRAALGPEHPDTLQSRYRLAEALRVGVKFAEAEAEHRAVLLIRQRVLGPEHPDTLASHLGVTRSLRGHLQNGVLTFAEEHRVAAEKEAAYRTLLASFERLLGEEHRETLTLRHALSESIHDQSRYAEVAAEDRARIPVEERVLGADHALTLQSRSELAGLLLELAERTPSPSTAAAQFAEAEKEARAVLALRQTHAKDPALYESYSRLAAILRAQRRFDEALSILSEAEVILDQGSLYDQQNNFARRAKAEIEAQMGRKPLAPRVNAPRWSEESLSTTRENLQISNDTAARLLAKGRFAEAETIYRSVLGMCIGMFGPEHEETFAARLNLTAVFVAEKKYDLAASNYRFVLGHRQRSLGSEHPETLRTRFALAQILLAQPKFPEAEAEHRAVLAARQRVLGAAHPETLQSHEGLVAVLLKQHRYADAEATRREMLATLTRVLSPAHPETLKIQEGLVSALWSQQHYAEAETQRRLEIAVLEGTRGAEHPETLNMRRLMAVALYSQRKFAEAEVELRAVLALRKLPFGNNPSDDPEMAKDCALLAHCLQAQKKSREALGFTLRAQAFCDQHGGAILDSDSIKSLRQRIEATLAAEESEGSATKQ